MPGSLWEEEINDYKPSRGFENPPDGRYQAVLEDAGIRQPGEDLELLEWKFRVITEPHKGRAITKTAWLTTKENRGFAWNHVKKFGQPLPTSWAEVPHLLKEKCGTVYDLTLKTNQKGYQQVWVNGRVIFPREPGE